MFQTDLERYGQLVGETIDGKIKGNLVRIGQMAGRQFWKREQKADRLKSRLTWFGLGAFILALRFLRCPRDLLDNYVNGCRCMCFL